MKRLRVVPIVEGHGEYETWFVAAAESLEEYLDLSEDEQVPQSISFVRQTLP